MDTPNEYSVCIRLIRQYRSDNIGWAVRLTDGYTQYSVRIRLIRRYRPFNIGWAVRLTDGHTQ
jgi:hypothetical protein